MFNNSRIKLLKLVLQRGISPFFALLILCSPGWAQAPSTGVAVQIQPQSGGGQFCFDARADRVGDGVPVFIFHCHGSENQRWTVTSSGNDRHAIIGIGGFCLDVRGSHSRASGTPVELWTCNFGANQLFHLSPDGRIREVQSGKCLIALAAKDQAPLVLDSCTNKPDELFVVKH